MTSVFASTYISGSQKILIRLNSLTVRRVRWIPLPWIYPEGWVFRQWNYLVRTSSANQYKIIFLSVKKLNWIMVRTTWWMYRKKETLSGTVKFKGRRMFQKNFPQFVSMWSHVWDGSDSKIYDYYWMLKLEKFWTRSKSLYNRENLEFFQVSKPTWGEEAGIFPSPTANILGNGVLLADSQ